MILWGFVLMEHQGHLEICARCGVLYVDYSPEAREAEAARARIAEIEKKILTLGGKAKMEKKERILNAELRKLKCFVNHFEKENALCENCGINGGAVLF